MQTWVTTVKDPCPKKFKAKETNPAHVDVAKPLKQDRKEQKDWKKKFQEKKELKDIPAIGDNIINTS